MPADFNLRSLIEVLLDPLHLRTPLSHLRVKSADAELQEDAEEVGLVADPLKNNSSKQSLDSSCRRRRRARRLGRSTAHPSVPRQRPELVEVHIAAGEDDGDARAGGQFD